jgi:hypothetical protein
MYTPVSIAFDMKWNAEVAEVGMPLVRLYFISYIFLYIHRFTR